MKLATTLRESLGLSQQQLTGFIGGNRSSLTRAEKKERNLTPAATLNLLTLFQIDAELVMPENEEAITPELTDKWKMHALACRHKIAALQKKLSEAKEGMAKARRLQNCLKQLTNTKAAELNQRQLRWVEEQHYQVNKKMASAGNGFQQELALAIAALEAEANIYEKATMAV